MRIRQILIISVLGILCGACSWSNFPFLYKPNVQQGNLLSEERLATIKVGMNRDEVTYLLGTPVLTNVINTDETQYVYTLQVKKEPLKIKKVSLIFSGDRLIKIA